MFLRIYADCLDDEVAPLVDAIETALIHYAPTPASKPRPYWKMPELFEFTYRLSSPTQDIWDELVTQRPEGWSVVDDSEDRSAVWNRRADLIFLVSAVRWAELAT